jgi:Icc-related predicted phosphoesterase
MVAAVLSDLHGIEARYRKARRLVEAEGIGCVLLAGDLAAGGSPEDQHRSVRTNFQRLLEAGKGLRVFAIPGNDDWKIVEETLSEFPEVTVPVGRAFFLTETLSIVGYPFVPITPFLVKDYEKWEDPHFPRIPKDPKERERAVIKHGLNLAGFRTVGMEVHEFSFDPADRKDNIAADLKAIAPRIDPERTIFMFHGPPFGFHDFGISASGPTHIGSRAIRAFIEEHRPWLTVHGHSHEAVERMNGKSGFRIGGSHGISVGPGNESSRLKGVLLDPERRQFRRFEI